MATKINRAKFFLAVRMDPLLFGGNMQQSAVDNINLFIDEFERRTGMLLTAFAAVLATALGEVGRAFEPVREGFSKTDAQAQAYVKRRYPHYAQTYKIVAGEIVKAAVGFMLYGRGYVQLTWLDNYLKFRAEILAKFGVDIVANPDAVLRPDIAIYIIFEGMIRGVFTGKKLADYFTPTKTNWVFRPIINGFDKAAYHASMAQHFAKNITQAAEAAAADAPVPPKVVLNNVTKREQNTTKVTGTGAAGTGVADGGAFDWELWTLIGVLVAIALLAAFLWWRKWHKFKAEWSKL